MTMCGGPDGASCDEVLENLYVFIDNELPEAEAAQLRAHIDGCVDCTAQQRVETIVRVLVQRGCREQAPETLRARVLLSIRQTTVTRID